MKKTALLVFVLVFVNSVYSQTNAIAGAYSLSTTNIENLKRTLVLNVDGTFTFHNYEYHEGGITKEKNLYARGTWTNVNKIVSFSTSTTDFDNKYTLDFNNTKARFHAKSSRDKSNRDIKTTLRFYKTELFWIQGMTLIKTE